LLVLVEEAVALAAAAVLVVTFIKPLKLLLLVLTQLLLVLVVLVVRGLLVEGRMAVIHLHLARLLLVVLGAVLIV
jgi:hypothetical protein